MVFFNLFKPDCFKSTSDDSFHQLTNCSINSELNIKLIHDLNQETVLLNNFSTYDTIFDKLKLLFEKYKPFENYSAIEKIINSSSESKRVQLFNDNKGESKPKLRKKSSNKEKLEKDKVERKSRKRSAQLAEISVIYEENELESSEKVKIEIIEQKNVIKKIVKEKQSKMFQKQNGFSQSGDESILIIKEKDNGSKKSRLSADAIDQELLNEVKTSKKTKSSKKTKKTKKKSSINADSTLNPKEAFNFSEQVEKLDTKILDLKNQSVNFDPIAANLKNPFNTTLKNNLTALPKISSIKANNTGKDTSKKPNQILSTSHQINQTIKKEVPISNTPLISTKSSINSKNQSSLDIKFSKPKSKIKDIIDVFEGKVKKIASNCKNIAKTKKISSVKRSSIGNRKAKLSASKLESKRRSIKHANLFIKDIIKELNKTTDKINNNNSLLSGSIQSQKLLVSNLTPSIKKNFAVVNHKSNTLNQTNVIPKVKINNLTLSKTPSYKLVSVNPKLNLKPSKPTENPIKNLNIEDLKYSESKYKELMAARKKEQAENKIKRLGSTSTISTVSSLNSSNMSANSFKNEMNSFKTVNTTFDNTIRIDKIKKIEVKMNSNTITRDKNTTFNVKPLNQPINKAINQKPQISYNDQKSKKGETPNKVKTIIAKVSNKIPTQVTNPKANGTFVVNQSINKKQTIRRSISANSTFCASNKNENYSIDDLKSGDETDDDEAPSKPIPEWANDDTVLKRAQKQAASFINFTKMFKSITNDQVNLDDIFKIKKKTFYQRSSSADWKTMPIWRTDGITGNESFRQINS